MTWKNTTIIIFGIMIISLIVGPSNYAKADSNWDGIGKIVPNKKVHVKELQVSKKAHKRFSVPIHKNKLEVQATAQPPRAIVSNIQTSKNFTTLGTLNGLGYDFVTPPDVQIAVGPSEIMEMDNLQGAVWTKAGTQVGGTFDLANFFGTGSDFISDPKIMYDSLSGRWIASILDGSQDSVKIAVSDSSNATSGVFCLYSVDTAFTVFPDQPILGVSGDKITIAVNDFDYKFEYSQFWVLNKANMLACEPTSFVTKTMSDQFSIHPAQSLSNETTQYMVDTTHNTNGSFVNTFAINGVPPNPVSLSITPVKVSPIFDPPSAYQAGTEYLLDTGDSRVQDASWSQGELWLTFTDSCFPPNDNETRSCARLVDIGSDNMSLLQDSDYGVSSKYLFYPALRPMHNENLFLLFGFSSATDYPSIGASELTKFQPPNSLDVPSLIKQGVGPVDLSYGCFSSCRYGDYFGVALDPSTPDEIWGAGEYGSGTKDPGGFGTEWGTWIAHFRG